MINEVVERYFATARERYAIWLRRKANLSPPWTNDPILRTWKFCNVQRENDRTTVWFRDNVRLPLTMGLPLTMPEEFTERKLRLVEATIAFRWFNRIETGRKVKDLLLYGWDSHKAYHKLKSQKPVVTGAFMVKTPSGRTKLRGLLWCIEQARVELPKIIPTWTTLENAHTSLVELPYMGSFNAYEICMDLRWTPVLSSAPDTMTWAASGPGATRGFGRLCGDVNLFKSYSKTDQKIMRTLMITLIERANTDPNIWPSDWPRWEMNEAERWACEFDKYMRVAADGKKMKRRFTPHQEL